MAVEQSARFVWFWTFWHWGRESFRDGVLLHSPLQGAGSHWDEWFRHEASDAERTAIARTGATEAGQRQFLAWFFRHWARDAAAPGTRPSARHVACQLAGLEPFCHWKPFARYRGTYGMSGVAAVVLGENSAGERADVRPVEAVVLPAEATVSRAKVIAEGFEPDGAELDTVERATMSLLAGRSFASFLALWIVCGRRPGATGPRVLVAAAWLGLGVLVGWLRYGPDPQDTLVSLCGVLLVAWVLLGLRAVGLTLVEAGRGWRQGRALAARFAGSQVRLRMNGGLHLQGASAGLPFCLNTLLALFRAEPAIAARSWLWRRCLGGLHQGATHSAATGVLTADGWITPVVLGPKLRACLRQPGIRHLFVPCQRGVGQRAVNALAGVHPDPVGVKSTPPAVGLRLGFAATQRALRLHRSGHLSQVMLQIGGLFHPAQLILNLYAVAVSVAMLLALPDLAHILWPPPAPAVVAPGSSSPYWLWVSLDTRQPGSFRVRLESEFWVNRMSEVRTYDGRAPRAVMSVQRLPTYQSLDEDNGIVWVERRRSFLGREFLPGEQVGRYPLSYVSRLSSN